MGLRYSPLKCLNSGFLNPYSFRTSDFIKKYQHELHEDVDLYLLVSIVVSATVRLTSALLLKKVTFDTLKSYFIYYNTSFYNSLYITYLIFHFYLFFIPLSLSLSLSYSTKATTPSKKTFCISWAKLTPPSYYLGSLLSLTLSSLYLS